MAQSAELIGPGDIIADSWINFRRNLPVYAEFTVWFALLRVVQWALTSLTQAYIDDRIMAFGLDLLCSLPVLFLYAVLSVSLISVVAKHLKGRKAGVRESLNVGFHKVFPAIWVSLVAGLFVTLGLAAIVIPGIVLIVWYRFGQDFVIIDDLKGMGALDASRKLSSGRWWAVFGRLVLPFLFFFVAVQFVTYLSYLLAGAIMGDPSLFFGQFTAIQNLPHTQTLVGDVLTSVIAGFAFPLFIGADLILWYELKRTA